MFGEIKRYKSPIRIRIRIIPTLNKIRKSVKIKRQVDKRIRELEQQSEVAGTLGKIKSKRGGSVEVLVKHKVAWPHEAILGGGGAQDLDYLMIS